ncbi:peptide chain release factor N(5)-glutamine methyltransferase [Rhodoferax sp. PAMC 29310]|uniref:peptide chain release factor N(5)-glutamine methyltransferase n=1 Tax=Rhodoferax sp. PAMC 29310 TaxID=2822760 RepID=UPI001B3333A1|nr:peptide chain release factor N(5)-glutamine methyltransferase [Rhodoferax sp. PAMC 29310]
MTSPCPKPLVAHTLADLQAQGLPRLDAQLLLLHALGQDLHNRAWLMVHDTEEVSEAALQSVTTAAQRRLQGEPMAYITGHKEFFGLDLLVDARVLDPRPDTETLVDWALEVLPPQNAYAPRVLDLGTGSGAIALALKATRPELTVHATDFSIDALEVAHANAQRLGLNVSFSQGAWFSALAPDTPRFHAVVSNPPYIAAEDEHLAALTHEPLQALASGADGLDDLRHLIANAPAHLLPGGWLLLEHGYDQALAVRALLHDAGFELVQSRQDLGGLERCSGGLLQT